MARPRPFVFGAKPLSFVADAGTNLMAVILLARRHDPIVHLDGGRGRISCHTRIAVSLNEKNAVFLKGDAVNRVVNQVAKLPLTSIDVGGAATRNNQLSPLKTV